MITIEITAEEQTAGGLSEAHLRQAVSAMERDGYVGLVNAVPDGICDHLYEVMTGEFQWAWERYGPFPVRGGDGYEGQRYNGHAPPPRRPHLFPEVVFNPFALDVNEALMGDGLHLHTYDANWAFPVPEGAKPARQGVHGDAGHLFPGAGYTPFFILNLSIPIVDFTEENGATEIWLGTHRLDRHLSEMSGEEARAALEARRGELPPERLVAPKGTIVIRDPRAWHAGMPNLTEKPRIMIAMRHFIFWMRCTMHREGDRFSERRLPVEVGSEDFFDNPRLKVYTESMPKGWRGYLHQHIIKARPELAEELLAEGA